MTRTRLTMALTTIVSIAGMQWISAQQPAQAPVDRVRHLYESAAYDDALETIGRIVTSPGAASSESGVLLQYRALCLLALDRSPEAEGAVEQLLMQDPDYSADANETSPRFVSVLDRTRSRVLPVLAQKQYQDAKESFDQRRLPEAATGFARVIALLDHPTVDWSSLASSRDLRTLANGFLELSRAAGAPPQQNAEPPATLPQAAFPQTTLSQATLPQATLPQATLPQATESHADRLPAPRASGQAVERIYSATDLDVTPPEIVRQDLPHWNGLYELFRSVRRPVGHHRR